MSWAYFGEEIRKVVGGFNLLDFDYPGGDQLLGKREDLRVDMLCIISFDESYSNLSYTSCVVFEDGDRWWLVG